MKKVIVAAYLLVAVVSGTLAQETVSPLHIGLKFGGNFSRPDGKAFADKARFGYELGGYASFDFIPFIGIQSELLYNRTMFESYAYTGDDGVKIDAGKKGIGYWSVPVMVRLNLGKILTLNAGPQWNILANKDKYKLSNDENALRNYVSFVTGLQLNVAGGRLRVYGRLGIGGEDFSTVKTGKKSTISQIQFGIWGPIF